MSHRYNEGDEVTSVKGIKGMVLEQLPPAEGETVDRYKVQTDVGVAVWTDDVVS